jgi:hypothetical protein
MGITAVDASRGDIDKIIASVKTAFEELKAEKKL